MVVQLKAARGINIEMVGPRVQEDLRVGGISAGDMASVLVRGVHQVPVVLELKGGLSLCQDVHLTQSHGAGKVLNVEGAQASRVELLLQDAVLLSEVHSVDLMAVHEVDNGELSGQAVHAR